MESGFSHVCHRPHETKAICRSKDSLGFIDLSIGSGEVDLGSLEDTVPTDVIVALKDDELADFDERDSAVYEQLGKSMSSGTDTESFMDLLAALIVSEEFQGIVASETGNGKSVDEFKTRVSTSRQRTPTRSVEQNSDTLPENFGGWATASSNFCQVLYNLNILTRSTTQTLPPSPTIPIASEGNSQTHIKEKRVYIHVGGKFWPSFFSWYLLHPVNSRSLSLAVCTLVYTKLSQL